MLGAQVVDEDRLAVLDAPDRELVAIPGVPRVRRIALAALDREPVLDLLAVLMVQPHAEDVGGHELIDAFVQRAEDRLDVE